MTAAIAFRNDGSAMNMPSKTNVPKGDAQFHDVSQFNAQHGSFHDSFN